jgi:3D (Asp-Asp-Asp) domain-containing protein
MKRKIFAFIFCTILCTYIINVHHTYRSSTYFPMPAVYKTIKATYYQPLKGQCDASPLETATGYHIDLKKLKNKQIRILAVSRDLLKKYPYHSEIYIHQPEHLRGCWKVEDTMNKRFKNKIDLLSYGKIAVDSVTIL